MPVGDTPTISTGTYANQIVDLRGWPTAAVAESLGELLRDRPPVTVDYFSSSISAQTNMPNQTNPNRRIVQVFIADPNENAPLEHAVLYKGDQKLTDLTDTELYFELPMADLLKSHNDKRVKWLDKGATKQAGKDMFLDQVKIRDLRMVVTTVAQF